ncbi:hypothetical protein K504DRAFT_489761 [Pleomassaria siparia CBS 279.74]|uniref:Carboxylesterase type B domain-containing protein n=1 Tax=Pleomassaria siparia CBS 279.74 TaxID=1314801 RepID=A0A6G1KD88_9PLEO|nr:hypothetical protein K504DRAFT_489761 [Pleomassaria siparia CBS 279.74]
MAPMPVAAASKLYAKLVEVTGVTEKGEAALENLRKLDVQVIVDASARLINGGEQWMFVEDDEWFAEGTGKVTWDRIPELLGKCDIMHTLTPTTFTKAMTDTFGPEKASSILKAYNVTRTMDNNLFLTSAFRWIGDIIFDAPTHAFAIYLGTHTTKKVYRYIFDVRNPFPNHPLYQQAHHWVDIYFVFKAHQFRYPTENLKSISTKHAQLWIDFANGKAPWKEYRYSNGKEAVLMIADEREGWVERSVGKDEALNERSWDRAETLWEAWKEKNGNWFSPFKIEPLENAKTV